MKYPKRLIPILLIFNAILISLAPWSASAKVHRDKILSENGYVLMEVLDDDLVHFEMSAMVPGPDDSMPIYTSPMVHKANYHGPKRFTQNANIYETRDIRVEIDPVTLGITLIDKTRNPELVLTTISPRNLASDWKGIELTSESFSHSYGLGQQFLTPGSADGDWVGRRRTPGGDYGNAMIGYEGGAVGNTQIPIIYFAGQGKDCYALFMDNQYRQEWNFEGSIYSGEMWGDRLRFYIMTGPDLKDLRRDYLELTGRPPMPPKKAFGLWVSEYGYDSWEEMEDKLSTLRANQFPVDGFVLDLQWFGGISSDDNTAMGSLTWDEVSFPAPADKLARLNDDEGLGIVVIEESYIGKNLEAHSVLAANGYLVKESENGAPVYLTGNPWWGKGGLFDWTNETGSAYWHDIKREPLIADGVIGHWTDLGEPEMYDETGWYAGIQGDQKELHAHGDVHNLFNLLWSKSIYEGYKRNGREERPWILSRSGTAGSQRYGVAMWSGDIGSNLRSLATHFNAQMHMSLSGIDYYGSDIGGFHRGALDSNLDELYTQWFANSAAFDVPLRPHTENLCNCKETAPDRIGWKTSNLANLRQRYEMTPYMYSLAYRAHLKGEPLFPPLVYHYQQDLMVREMGHEKLIGKDLLVAIVAAPGERDRAVYLPAGKWVNYHTNTAYDSSGQWISPFSVILDGEFKLPMFARAGAIIPQMRVDDKTMNVMGRRLDDSTRDELIVRVYPDATPSRFVLYEDDGSTNSYKAGKFHRTRLSQHQKRNRVKVFIGKTRGCYPGAIKKRDHIIRLIKDYNQTPKRVRLNRRYLHEYAALEDFNTAESGWFNAGRNLVLAKSGPMSIRNIKRFVFYFDTVSSAPPPPVHITAIGGDQRVDLDWDDVSDAVSYNLYYTDDGSTPEYSSARIDGLTESEYTHLDLTNGLIYNYRIAAVNIDGEGELSHVATVIPAEPLKSNLGEGAILRLTGQVFSNWNPNNPDFMLTLVDDNTWEILLEIPAPLIDTPYKFTLNGSWEVSWGGGVGTDTQLVNGGGNALVNLAAGKYILRVTEGDTVAGPIHVKWIRYFESVLGQDAKLRLTGEAFSGWDPANTDFMLSMVADHTWETTIKVSTLLENTPYKLTLNGTWEVHWGGGASGTDTLLVRDGNNATATLAPGTYFLRVTEGADLDSPIRVQWIEWSVPQVPMGLSATAGDQSITLQWHPAPMADSYTVYFTDDGSSPTNTSSSIGLIETTSYLHQGLTNGVTYKYRVAAVNSYGESNLSDEIEVTPSVPFLTRFGQGAVLRLTGGNFSAWDPANSEYVLTLVDNYTWRTTVMVPDPLSDTQYKFTLNGTWNINWGGGASGTDAWLARTGDNAIVTLGAGVYTLNVEEGSSIEDAIHVQWIYE